MTPKQERVQRFRDNPAPCVACRSALAGPAWVDAHYERTGTYPHAEVGPVADAPGEMWLAVQIAMVEGLRELPGGSSLARLLHERRGVPIYKGRPWRNTPP